MKSRTRSPETIPPNTQNGCVLVVGDHHYSSSDLDRLLTLQGYEVLGVETGAEYVIDLAARSPSIDLVIVETSDQVDAAELVRRIKAVNQYARVVLCSTPGSAKRVGHALCAGALGVIMRPFDPDQLTSLLRLALETLPGEPSDKSKRFLS